jgi:tape measure domain-containing protein
MSIEQERREQMAKKNTVEIILAAKDKASKITQKAFGSVQSSAQVALGAVKTASIAAAGAVATVSGVVGKMGISYNAMIEQSQVAWTTLLGSTEKAQEQLKKISDFTKATPFETADVDMMAKYMHNAGLEGQKLFGELLKVSDVASAFAIPAAEAKEMTRQMSQVRQAGVAYTEDLNILADRGVPIFKAIADQQGIMVKDVKKMASEGKISSDIYIDAFNSIAKGVEGASADQSKTFNGMLSTLKDNIKIFSGEVTKGVFEKLKGFLPIVIDVVERLGDAFKAGGWKGVMEEFLPPGVVDFITTGFEMIKDVFNQVKDTVLANKDQIVGVFEFYKSYWLGWVDYVKSLFSGEGNIGESFIRIFNTIKSIALPILQDAISFIKSTLDELKKFWNENGEQIIQAVKNFFNVLAVIFNAIAPVILFILKMLWDNVKGVISGALDIIMGLIKVFAGLFTGDFSKMWEGIKQLFFGAIEFVWNLINLLMVGRILGGIKAFSTKTVGLFKDLWAKTVEIFKNLDTYVMNIVSSFTSKIIGFFQKLLDGGKLIFGTLRHSGESIFNSLLGSIKSVAMYIYDAVIGRFTSMTSGATSSFSGLLSSAKNIFGQIKEAITKPINAAKETVKSAIDSIKGFFSNIVTKIPMPHFKMSNFSLNPKDWITNGMPKLNVDWYDKGGVFTGPQIIGVGEKRPEFVGALDDIKKHLRDVIREEKGNGGPSNINQNINIYSPSPLSPSEIARKNLHAARQLAMEWGV